MIGPATTCEEHSGETCIAYAVECADCGVENGVILHQVGKPEALHAVAPFKCGGCEADIELRQGQQVFDCDDEDDCDDEASGSSS